MSKIFKLFECVNSKGDKRQYMAVDAESAVMSFWNSGYIRKVTTGYPDHWRNAFSHNCSFYEVSENNEPYKHLIIKAINADNGIFRGNSYRIAENTYSKNPLPEYYVGNSLVEVPFNLEQLKEYHAKRVKYLKNEIAHRDRWWKSESDKRRQLQDQLRDANIKIDACIEIINEYKALKAMLKEVLFKEETK